MSSTTNHIGIDISKDYFDVAINNGKAGGTANFGSCTFCPNRTDDVAINNGDCCWAANDVVLLSGAKETASNGMGNTSSCTDLVSTDMLGDGNSSTEVDDDPERFSKKRRTNSFLFALRLATLALTDDLYSPANESRNNDEIFSRASVVDTSHHCSMFSSYFKNI